jgi:cytochrome P450
VVTTSDLDLFADDVLADPYPHLRVLRDAAPAVWLSQHDVWAVTRYADVRAVLADDTTFVSGEGVGLNDFINTGGRGTTLMSDGEEHARQREIIGRPLTPRSLADLRPSAQRLADEIVDRLVAQRTFDAVTELAEVLPATWVPDLLGWPAEGRDRLLDWAAASFDGLGPLNDRAIAAGEGIIEMTGHAQRLAAGSFPEGSFAARILAAAAAGEIEAGRCPMLMIDYLAPSLDTTISAIGNAVWLLAEHPDQWDVLRASPRLARKALDEALRLESPIRCFTRVARVDTEVGGTPIPAGSRLLLSFASANRDERRWEDPERFAISREAAGHVAFGYGEHACVGMGLARLEGVAVLGALAERIAAIELAGPPTRKPNNLINAFATLPVEVTPA